MRLPMVAVTLVMAGCNGAAEEVRVGDVAGLREALRGAEPGDEILVAPGEYAGGLYFENLHGSADEPIVIRAEDPEDRPTFTGGGAAFHLADVSYLELRDLIITGQTGNGLNIDDGGSFDTPAHHIALSGLTVTDVGPSGNRDGIKLSGVDDFRVEDCTIERWGSGGSAIDLVGCHRGVIEGCTFRAREGFGSSGPQMKGGTSEVTVRGCLFENGGGRAVNIGGSTGLQFFRPRVDGYEAKDITVEGNVFVGSMGVFAFVGVDGATVRYNTVHVPEKWALRILQETREEGFVPCRNGIFTDNIIVFESGKWGEGGCNIGPGTAPETFRFERNLWYCTDRPERSRPSLPAEEVDGVYGIDPELTDPETGDFTLRDASPAAGKGHTALPEE